MNKRPLSITVVGWLFVCVGCVSLVAGVRKFISPSTHANMPGSNAQNALDLALVVVRAMAEAAGGAFVLRGHNWARWLLVGWLTFHVVLSALHPLDELLVHSVLFAVGLYVLFRAPASAYFRSTTTLPRIPKSDDTGSVRRRL